MLADARSDPRDTDTPGIEGSWRTIGGGTGCREATKGLYVNTEEKTGVRSMDERMSRRREDMKKGFFTLYHFIPLPPRASELWWYFWRCLVTGAVDQLDFGICP